MGSGEIVEAGSLIINYCFPLFITLEAVATELTSMM